MADEITVVNVRREGRRSFFVEFSHPVVHPAYPNMTAHLGWYASDEEDKLFDALDELGAFMWGQKVIKRHKEMENGKKP